MFITQCQGSHSGASQDSSDKWKRLGRRLGRNHQEFWKKERFDTEIPLLGIILKE